MRIGDIVSDVPAPPRSGTKKYKAVHLQAGKMKVGDSFNIRLVKKGETTASAIYATLRGRYPDRKHAVREISDGVLRIWRIK